MNLGFWLTPTVPWVYARDFTNPNSLQPNEIQIDTGTGSNIFVPTGYQWYIDFSGGVQTLAMSLASYGTFTSGSWRVRLYVVNAYRNGTVPGLGIRFSMGGILVSVSTQTFINAIGSYIEVIVSGGTGNVAGSSSPSTIVNGLGMQMMGPGNGVGLDDELISVSRLEIYAI